MTTIPAIACRSLEMRFASGPAAELVLRGLDLNIRAGEFTIIAGPSGCGKTTLLSIIGGCLKPTGGEVAVFDRVLTKMSAAELVAFRRKEVGFIFQQYYLVPALTATENAAMPLIIAGARPRTAFAAARRELARLGLERQADRLPRELSGGQQQRVAIARALVHEPRLIICDEPTAALDSASGEAAMTILRGLASEEGRAVIAVTHDQRTFSFADRLIELEDGRIRADKTLAPRHPAVDDDGQGGRTARQAA
jgi:putative ABC transport system ATP-binding protein